MRICVFCGSSFGRLSSYRKLAEVFGEALVGENLGLVYGGASIGLMGAIADKVSALGGEVIGVIPRALVDLEMAHSGLTHLHIVESMHARKALMAELSDGFVALPGGIGTLEELFEVWSWRQLRFHAKPCGLLNVDGYYTKLLEFIDHVEGEGFVTAKDRRLLFSEQDPEKLIKAIKSGTTSPGKAVRFQDL